MKNVCELNHALNPLGELCYLKKKHLVQIFFHMSVLCKAKYTCTRTLRKREMGLVQEGLGQLCAESLEYVHFQ